MNIRVTIYPRSEYKKMLAGQLQSSKFHAIISRSQILFSKDEAIEAWHKNLNRMGERNRETQLMTAANDVTPTLMKAEKWFHAKKDLNYSFLYILYAVERLARVEVIMHGKVLRRKVINQAITYNPDFFNPLYTVLIHTKKDKDTVRQALEMINQYLEDRLSTLFQLLFDFLTVAGSPRTITEISEHSGKRLQNGRIGSACR